MLERAGVIKIKPGVGTKATILDIVDSPKKIEIYELDAAQLPRSLEDVDLAAINTNYAMEVGLDPIKDAIFREDADALYVNIINCGIMPDK